MAEIDRERLIAKYPAINYPRMDPALNTTVQAVVRGDQIAAKTWESGVTTRRYGTPCCRRKCTLVLTRYWATCGLLLRLANSTPTPTTRTTTTRRTR